VIRSIGKSSAPRFVGSRASPLGTPALPGTQRSRTEPGSGDRVHEGEEKMPASSIPRASPLARASPLGTPALFTRSTGPRCVPGSAGVPPATRHARTHGHRGSCCAIGVPRLGDSVVDPHRFVPITSLLFSSLLFSSFASFAPLRDILRSCSAPSLGEAAIGSPIPPRGRLGGSSSRRGFGGDS
jgi:hypothetical protein